MKKKTKGIIIAISVILIWNHLPYHYSNEKAAAYVTSHSAPKSRSMCAWYVIKSMWHGGCPIGLIPAYAYEKTLPQMGFEEIPSKGYKPMKGDISVLLPVRLLLPHSIMDARRRQGRKEIQDIRVG